MKKKRLEHLIKGGDEASISRLKEKFPEAPDDEISKIYYAEKELIMKENPKIIMHVPIFSYRATKDVLEAKYGKKISKKW